MPQLRGNLNNANRCTIRYLNSILPLQNPCVFSYMRSALLHVMNHLVEYRKDVSCLHSIWMKYFHLDWLSHYAYFPFKTFSERCKVKFDSWTPGVAVFVAAMYNQPCSSTCHICSDLKSLQSWQEKKLFFIYKSIFLFDKRYRGRIGVSNRT